MLRTQKLTMLALGLSGVATLAACGDLNDGPNAPTTASEESAGEIGVRLRIANGHNIDSATYAITGPNGYSKSGAIDLSSATKISATIGGIPAGSGYSITLSANSDGGDTCGGSATFSIVAHQTTNITVPVACREPGRTGSVGVTGVLNICPTIDGIGANPAEVQVGGSVALSAAAHDSDAGPSALSYAWTASAGTLSNASLQNPTFTCGSTPGTVTVDLTVSDGDAATTCADTQTTQITCSVAVKTPGTYVAGDFHNHTTCSDGSISLQKLLKKATDKVETPWGLDWFVQAGHGGNGNRNCTLVEDSTLDTPAYPFATGKGPTTTWAASGVTLKGTTSGGNMWRWQSIQEFQYPVVEYMNAYKNLPLFLGIETVNPGHEHTSMAVLNGQIPTSLDSVTLPTTPGYTPVGDANLLAQFEYCFDRNDTDDSRGTATNNWDCSVPGSPNSTDPALGWSTTAHKLIPAGGTGTGTRGASKTIEALKWMALNAPDLSYFVPAHLERAGQFNPDGNNGFNIENLRNFNNAAPRIAFGFESQPGHGASDNRGEYQIVRNSIGGVPTDSVGGTTFGGTGVYAGYVGGVWDALLGEGRNWWFFASSDWHNRGTFGPDDRRTSQDFYPGEYQRNYTMVRAGTAKIRPQALVDGLRSGNNWASQGQLIDRLGFVACSGKAEGLVAELAANTATSNSTIDTAGCATMGEKLVIDSGADIVIGIAVRDPEGVNFSPYTFPNPSLKQVMANPPVINEPVLDHLDVITGLVTGYVSPTDTANYAGAWPANTAWMLANGTTTGLASVPPAAKNTSAAIAKTFGTGASAWSTVTSPVDGSTFYVMTYKVSAVTASKYFRLRGTNMPPLVPSETDAAGNPLADVYTNANDPTRLTIPCNVPHSASSQFDGCPDHLKTASGASPIAGQKAVTNDVASWSDLWFYANPIYVQVNGSVVVAGVN